MDVPGFENEINIKLAIEKFQFSREKINKSKDNIHTILYSLNFIEVRAFIELEYLMFDEILKNESSEIIYVITHCIPEI